MKQRRITDAIWAHTLKDNYSAALIASGNEVAGVIKLNSGYNIG